MSFIADSIEANLEGSDARLKGPERAVALSMAGGFDLNNKKLLQVSEQAIPSPNMMLERLVVWANFYGVIRRPAALAAGIVQFTGTNGSIIPAGTIVQNNNGTQYTTNVQVIIAAGAAQVTITATDAGLDGNLKGGQKVSLTTPIVGVDAQAIAIGNGIQGGKDIETFDELLERLYLKVRSPLNNGSSGDWVRWAKEVPGVTRAWEIGWYQGPGKVGVFFVLDDSDPITPNPAKVAEMQTHLESPGHAPVGSTPVAAAPTLKTVNIQIRLRPDSELSRANSVTQLRELFDDDARIQVGKTLYRSQISGAIDRATGEDSHDLLAPAANVTVAADELVVLGAITFVA